MRVISENEAGTGAAWMVRCGKSDELAGHKLPGKLGIPGQLIPIAFKIIASMSRYYCDMSNSCSDMLVFVR